MLDEGREQQAISHGQATDLLPQPTADFCDDHPAAQVMQSRYASYGSATRCLGRVETISTRDDNSKVKSLLQQAGDGRVLLIDNSGSTNCAMLGGNLATLAADNDWAGIIVNGAVRDVEELKDVPILIFALASCPRKSRNRGTGTLGTPVRVGGLLIRRNDILAADADGVAVLASWGSSS